MRTAVPKTNLSQAAPGRQLRSGTAAPAAEAGPAAAEGAERSVKSAGRVLDILEHLAPRAGGAAFPELSRALGIPKSSLHALLGVLTGRGWLELDAETRRYRLGTRLWETAQAFPRHHDVFDAARAMLRRLVADVNETAQLAVLAGADNVYLAKEESSHPLRLQSEAGARLPAHVTGVGKALLAQLADAEVAARLGGPALAAFTAATHASLPALLAELAATRARGFAVDNEECSPGVFCLAVPVFDHSGRAAMAASVAVPTSRLTPDRLAAILCALARGSLEVAARTGAPCPDPALARLADPATAAGAIAALLATLARHPAPRG